MTPKDSRSIAEKVAAHEALIPTLATAAQVSELMATVRELKDENSRQHASIKDMLFNPDNPVSLQSQITTNLQEQRSNLQAFEDRAFGDSPVSLRSRLTSIEKGNAFRKGKAVMLVTLSGIASTVLAWFKDDIAGWFHKMLAK